MTLPQPLIERSQPKEEPTATSDAVAGRRRVWRATVIASAVAIAIGIVAHYTLERRAGTPTPPPDATAPTAVHTAAAYRDNLSLVGLHTGELETDAAEIAAQATGLLREVRVRIGDRVARGDVLARVDTQHLQKQVAEATAQIRVADAAEQRALAQLRAAQSELERTLPLLEERLVSPQDIDSLRSHVDTLVAERETAAAQRQQARARIAALRLSIRDARLVAPFDGAIAERYLNPGATVHSGTPVLRIVRSGPLRVRFRVAERDLGRIRVGMPLHVTTQATGARRWPGEMVRLSAEVSRVDRTIAAEGLLREEDPALRPGMYAQVHLVYGALQDVVMMPALALVERHAANGASHFGVFVVEEATARWREVRIMGRADDRAAVEGIEAGMDVVTLGHEALHEGSRVRVVEGDRS